MFRRRTDARQCSGRTMSSQRIRCSTTLEVDMPSIEILSVECSVDVVLPDYRTFRWTAELGVPQGHRGSFDNKLSQTFGFFVHLGNKSDLGSNYWTAYELVDLQAIDRDRERDIFPLAIPLKETVAIEVVDLCRRLALASPKRQIMFMTDYQLAERGEGQTTEERMELEGFLDSLTHRRLLFNALYHVS